uniref:Tail protein n=1 Tax=viral metagenome TaxID=1070528 RepID=A0A6H1ZA52_9ZZZZ
MSIEIADIRDALITQLKADTDIKDIFSTRIDYGLGRNVTLDMLPNCVRIVQLGRGVTATDAEIEAEFGSGYTWVWAHYRLHVIAIFEQSNEKTAEDAESDYDRKLRKAITKDRGLGGLVTDIDIGRTVFRTHPEKDSTHYVILEITALTHERSDVR